MKRALALAALVACASAAPREVTRPAAGPRVAATVESGTAQSRVAGSGETAQSMMVARAVEEMSRVRELSVTREVSAEILSRDDLMRALVAHVAREVPPSEIERESIFLKTLGVLGPDEDYEREVYASVRRVAGGIYLPERGAMLLPGDLPSHELATSLAHEAVHALQDQHFGLEAFERYEAGASDAMLARSCLAEGDATSATEEEPADVNGSYVERELAAPYVAGTAFVRALRARGGWAEVDRAWRRGGLTTEQVLHPEKWDSDERALRVPDPKFATLGPGLVAMGADTQGELGVRLVLESAMPRTRAAEAASGWGGDRSLVLRGRGTALAWRIRWDDDASARRGLEAMKSAFARGRACSEERASPTAVAAHERDVLLLVGPPGARCTLLDAWSREVFSE